MRGALLALLLALAPAAARAADAGPPAAELRAPRPFGWMLGDVIAHEVALSAPEGFRPVPGALPRPRPLTYWLDLRSTELVEDGTREGRGHWRLRLSYQVFFGALEVRGLDVPGFAVAFGRGEERAEVAVPPWHFLASPLREVVPAAASGGVYLRPDSDLPAPDPGRGRGRGALLAAALASLALLVLLARHHAWGPFGRRPDRPFARARRALGRALRTAPGAAGHAAALRALHRGFDAAAGRRLLAEDLPRFLDGAPALRPLAGEIGRFFDASRRGFFGGDPEGAMAALPPDALADLARRLARAERGGAPT